MFFFFTSIYYYFDRNAYQLSIVHTELFYAMALKKTLTQTKRRRVFFVIYNKAKPKYTNISTVAMACCFFFSLTLCLSVSRLILLLLLFQQNLFIEYMSIDIVLYCIVNVIFSSSNFIKCGMYRFVYCVVIQAHTPSISKYFLFTAIVSNAYYVYVCLYVCLFVSVSARLLLLLFFFGCCCYFAKVMFRPKSSGNSMNFPT